MVLVQEKQQNFINALRAARQKTDPPGEEKILQARNELLAEGLDLNNEQWEEIVKARPDRPSFPIFIFGLAVFKDIVDFLSLGILGIVINVVVTPLIWLWLLGKLSFFQRWALRRMVVGAVVEFLPFLSFIPIWSIFVIRVHLKEHEQIDKILTTLEKHFG